MSLHLDLLSQAGVLLRHEPRRPRQASLRRAVSTTYYALFHLLVDEATRMLISGASSAALRALVARSFAHATMREACRSFATNQLPSAVAPVVVLPISMDLRFVAKTFLDLQEARHLADYDLSARFTRRDAGMLLQQAQHAVAAWRRIRGDTTAKAFLAALLLWRDWRR